MANRTARLRREREAYDLERLYKTALRQSKQKRQLQRSARQLQREIENKLHLKQDAEQQRILRFLLRRKSMRETFGKNIGFSLVVLHCLGMGMHWRELDRWQAPRSRKPARVFDSLARQILIRYELPQTLYRAVLKTVTEENAMDKSVLNWFLHVTRGDNLSRAPGLPFEFTKKAAHYLDQAPEQFEITEAMRWAQVRAMGGSPEAACSLGLHLGQPEGPFEPEWTAVIRFIIRHWKSGYVDQVPRILAFMRSQRMEPLEIGMSDVQETVEPLFPNFDISQATEQSLMSRMETWEAHVQALQKAIEKRPFPRMGMLDRYDVQTPLGPVQILRIKNIQALVREGALMRHCVGGYGTECRQGYSSIWSLRTDNGDRRLATVQIGRNKQLMQFSGKANSRPGPEAVEAVKIWAKLEGLQLKA